jgi:site-specific DNA-cytosine methylase
MRFSDQSSRNQSRLAVSLFSGVGGLDIGPERAGFKMPLRLNSTETAVQAIQSNHTC